MSRIMALDVGEVTLGVALSDPLRLTAQPFTTIRRAGIRRDLQAVTKIISGSEVTEIVVGLPLNLRGDEGPAAKATMEFVDKLRKHVDVPVETWDERFSTVQAERSLIEADVGRKRRRQVINHVAASIILQSYLDAQAGRTR